MSFESVLAPGNSIDVTVSEILINGDTLPAAVEEWEWTTKTEEELTYFQGFKKPVERTGGQLSYELTLTWGGRQWELFKQIFGGWDNVNDLEFQLTIICRPKNDSKYYEFRISRLRFLDEGGKIGKEAFKQPIRCSCMSIDSQPHDNAA